MIRLLLRVNALLVLLSLTAAAGAAAASPLRAAIELDSIVFSGVTLGGDLVLFGASIRNEWGTQTRTQYTEVLADADGDGVVVYQPRGGVPFRSIWTGIDLRSGGLAVVAPSGYELHHAELPSKLVKHDRDGLPVALETNRFRAFVLIVRPDSGAWLYAGAQDGARDSDRAANGRLTAVFGDAQTVGGKKENAPQQLKRGDVIAMLDPDSMDLWTWTVSK